MPSPTLTDIQNALTTTLLRIKVVNGYSYDIPNDHVYKISQRIKLESVDPADFPKLILSLDRGKNKKLPAHQFDTTARFSATLFIKEVVVPDPNNPPHGWLPVAIQLQSLIKDFETVVLADPTLGNLVIDTVPSDFETDSDNAWPVGILVYYFDILYRRIV